MSYAHPTIVGGFGEKAGLANLAGAPLSTRLSLHGSANYRFGTGVTSGLWWDRLYTARECRTQTNISKGGRKLVPV